MTNNTKVKHEPEIEVAKEERLYRAIIDLLNETEGVSIGAKISALAWVLHSISVTVTQDNPDEEKDVVAHFFEVLALIKLKQALEG